MYAKQTVLIVAGLLAAATKASIMGRLDAGASELEQKFLPMTDFDTDGCYFTAAIGPNGEINPGLPNPIFKGTASDCRKNNQLENNNLYSRSRCNNGWYEYYFEKDQTFWGKFGTGHNHDWENIVIFAQGDTIKRVAPSAHGKYKQAVNQGWLQNGTHAKFVYHKNGLSTHCWRLGRQDHDDYVENFTGEWMLGNLIGWNNYTNIEGKGDTRLMLYKGFPETKKSYPKFWDAKDTFTKNLRLAACDSVPGFDPAKDE